MMRHDRPTDDFMAYLLLLVLLLLPKVIIIIITITNATPH